jgi:competence protein ComEC
MAARWLVVLIGLVAVACAAPIETSSAVHHPELPLGPAPGPNAEMRIHLIDVGQGAATLIEFSCGVVLVDTGGEQNNMFNSEQRLISYLDRFFRTHKQLHSTIALLVLTHPHIDHTRSAMAVFRHFKVSNVVTDGMIVGSGGDQVGDLLTAAQHARIGDERISARDVPATGIHDAIVDPISCADGDPDIRAFWGAVEPRDVDWDHEAIDNANNDSVVMRFRLGQASFLITGDLERDGIGEVVKKFGGELRADVWEVGHHGSWNATTKPLLDAIQPKVALISMGRVERQDTWSAWAYGHPRVEAIELLEPALTGPKRDAIHVSVGTGAKEFLARDITAPIYATGWDGDVLVTLHADGREVVRIRPEH